MKVGDYRRLAPEGSPPLPDELDDDEDVETYLTWLISHAARVAQIKFPGSEQIFFEVDKEGTLKGGVSLEVEPKLVVNE